MDELNLIELHRQGLAARLYLRRLARMILNGLEG